MLELSPFTAIVLTLIAIAIGFFIAAFFSGVRCSNCKMKQYLNEEMKCDVCLFFKTHPDNQPLYNKKPYQE